MIPSPVSRKVSTRGCGPSALPSAATKSGCRSSSGKRFRSRRRPSSALAPTLACINAERTTSSTPLRISCRASMTFKGASGAARHPRSLSSGTRNPMPNMPKTALKALPAARPTTATIALVQSSSLPMLVQKELERMILAGEIAVGAKLNEVALAERLGVSRGPVREAFRALEESGLVHLEKNRGGFVRQTSIDEADGIYEVRATLDEWVVRRLAQTA